MNVAEFIEYLRAFDQDVEVFMSKDAEGNGFRPFYEAELVSIDEDWEGVEEYMDDDIDTYDDSVVLALWPE